MKKSMFYIPLVCLLAIVAGCASIVSGGTDQVTLTSEPEGATVSLNGVVLGKTPLNTTIDKMNDPTLTFELDGYKTYKTILPASVNPIILGNVIIGGVFGTTTDSVSGAMYQYDKKHFYIELVPEQQEAISVPNTRVSAKMFIVKNAVDIRVLASEGVVELELAELLAILEVPKILRTEAAATIGRLSSEHADDVKFADAILAELSS